MTGVTRAEKREEKMGGGGGGTAGRSKRADATLTRTGAGNPTCKRQRGFCRELMRVGSGKTFSHMQTKEGRVRRAEATC